MKNTNYWNKDNIVPEKITFVMMKDATLALAGIKDGSLDFSVYIIVLIKTMCQIFTQFSKKSAYIYIKRNKFM